MSDVLRAADALAHAVEEQDTPLGPLKREVQAYRAARDAAPAGEQLASVDDVAAVETRTWDEVHLTGQPPGGFPFYDFTFRSDRDNWRHVDDFLDRITLDWTDVRVERRTVSTTTRTTDWKADER